ncbi:MAG TPA: acyl-CoA carboxylase subunit epsilon [Acidothermales bacterium]
MTVHLRVVRGEPSAEELAAVLAVLTARAAPRTSSATAPSSAWADPRRRVRVPLAHGPGAWRASALPG